MKHMINGRIVDVPTSDDGGVDSTILRQAANIPPDRPLILQLPDGTNKLINPEEKLKVEPGQYFVDAPAHIRGGVCEDY